MTPNDFLGIINSCCFGLQQAIQTGAQWEVVAHSVIANALLTHTGRVPLREAKYKYATNAAAEGEACDFLIQDGTQMIWLELKVESATNIGSFAGSSLAVVTSLDPNVNNDVRKLQLASSYI